MTSIYHYFDYREYLKAFIAEHKAKSGAYSHRGLLTKMGITSSGFLANVLSRKNHFTSDHIESFAKIAKLSKHEETYLYNMVFFAKSKKLAERNHFYELLLASQRSSLKQLSEKQLGLFTQWYYVAIRELLNFYECKDDYKALGRMLNPPITPAKAKNAVMALEKIGLIKKDSQGFFRQVDSGISTGDEVQSFQVANFQVSMIDLARNTVEKIKSDERDVSGVTLTLSPESFAKIKEEIRQFRKRLSQIGVAEKSPDRVFRCNVQCFPLTRKSGRNA